MIYARQMNKSNLDRSSRSVIDSYKEKFRLSNQNLEALKNFLLQAQSTAEELRTIMDQQVIDMHEQVEDATNEASNFCQNGDATIQTLQEIDDALNNVENDLEDVANDIQDQLDCLDACYGSCQNDQGNACTTGCEIDLDCGESCTIQGGGCTTVDEGGSEEPSCVTVDEDALCFSMEIACAAECQDNSEGITCLASGNKTCTDYGEASCVQVGEDYCIYSGEDACVFPGERACSYPGETTCADTGEEFCWAIGEEDCQYAGELNCTKAGETGCEQVGELSCIQIGEEGCIKPGEDGCVYKGEASCVEVGEDILCFTMAIACVSDCQDTGESCHYSGEADCQAAGEADCGYAGEDWTTCDQPVLLACAERWGNCGSTTECPPAFGEAAECGYTQGCNVGETCGGTCNTTCANCEAACTGSCNTTCANGECSPCRGSCNTTCANGECGTCTGGCQDGCTSNSLTCCEAGCTSSCNAGCTGTCQEGCTTGTCHICTGSIYQ